MSVPLCMSVSVWLVLPCVWASLGQLWVKSRGTLNDLGAIMFFRKTPPQREGRRHTHAPWRGPICGPGADPEALAHDGFLTPFQFASELTNLTANIVVVRALSSKPCRTVLVRKAYSRLEATTQEGAARAPATAASRPYSRSTRGHVNSLSLSSSSCVWPCTCAPCGSSAFGVHVAPARVRREKRP